MEDEILKEKWSLLNEWNLLLSLSSNSQVQLPILCCAFQSLQNKKNCTTFCGRSEALESQLNRDLFTSTESQTPYYKEKQHVTQLGKRKPRLWASDPFTSLPDFAVELFLLV